MTTRQEFIRDVIEHYIKNNKEEYTQTLKQIKERRKLLNNKDLATSKNGEFRASFQFPPGLWSALDMALDEPRFLRLKGEAKWISKKYPQFLVPQEY